MGLDLAGLWRLAIFGAICAMVLLAVVLIGSGWGVWWLLHHVVLN